MTQLPEIPNFPGTLSKSNTPASSGAQEIPKPTGRRQFPDNLEFLNDKVILDVNVFSKYANVPHEVLNKVGGRSIHHSAVIRLELAKYYKNPDYFLDDSSEEVDSVLAEFSSTLLPDTDDMGKIAKAIRYFLPRAGIPYEQVEDAKNDIRIMSCGIVNGADIITADRLFYVMGEIFKTNIRIILLSKPPEGWITTARNTLKNLGISTPIDLLGIALNQDFA